MAKKFTPIDKSAPRYRAEKLDLLATRLAYRGTYRVNPFYKELKQRYPNLEKYTDKQIRQYITNFNNAQAYHVVNNRDGISMLNYIGNLLIISTLTNRNYRRIDRKKSSETGKITYYDNKASGGYTASCLYTPSIDKYKFPNSDFWYFKPCRELVDAKAAQYRKNWKLYIIAPNVAYAQNFIREYNKKQVTDII